MKRRVRLEAFARIDLWQSIDWYNEEQTDLGWQFAEEMLAELGKIAEDPFRFRVIRIKREVRKAVLVTRFEFTVYFSATRDELIVYSLFHPSRDPRMLRKRGII